MSKFYKACSMHACMREGDRVGGAADWVKGTTLFGATSLKAPGFLKF